MSGPRVDAGPLAGQVALVTGAGSGIGAETCVRLARDGAAVAANDLTAAAAQATVDRVLAVGGRAVAVPGSVSDAGDVERMFRGCLDAFDGLHVVVNNAGMQTRTPFLELGLDQWRAQLAVDLDGAFLVAQRAAVHMVENGGGVIVNVTSVHEHQPQPGLAAYCVAKAGLGMLTKVMARELTGRGVRTLSVAPGAIDTPIQDDDGRQRQRDGIPAGRLAQPEEVAAMIAFLASPSAAYVSGSSVVVDGGLMTQVSLA